ncbi:MAG: arginine deiminase-related protein [Bacteroidia bacterium]
MQATKHILLVKPSNFAFNSETAGSNAFQNNTNENSESINKNVSKEFDAFANTLKSKGVNVTIVADTAQPPKPDAVFPNNWISFHEDGTVVLYPMFAPNRRLERRYDIIDSLKESFIVSTIIDFTQYETKDRFLEGTGSIVFDHENKIAYACISPRTDKLLFTDLCGYLHYTPICFSAYDKTKKQIYHTNVMMCIAEKFAVVCLESITDKKEKELVLNSLKASKHEVIEITIDQMNNFAGNMLALQNNDDKNMLVLSQSAYDSLNASQKILIEKYCQLVPLGIKTIETIGGGSARCMIAEVFLPLIFE